MRKRLKKKLLKQRRERLGDMFGLPHGLIDCLDGLSLEVKPIDMTLCCQCCRFWPTASAPPPEHGQCKVNP